MKPSHEIKTEIESNFRKNAGEVAKGARVYAQASLYQAIRCVHSQANICDDCQRESDNLNYFSVCLGIVADAVDTGAAESLFAQMTLWAKDNLPDFPHSLATRPLYERGEAFFPDTIENFQG